MKFFVHCNPPKSTHQGSLTIMRRKDGSPFVGKMSSSKGKAAKNTITTMMSKYAPDKAFDGPVYLDTIWVYPWRKSEKKANLAKGFLFAPTRPDCDNLVKMQKDIMTTLCFWGDDSQVAYLRFRKGWGDTPGIYVSVNVLGDNSATSVLAQIAACL